MLDSLHQHLDTVDATFETHHYDPAFLRECFEIVEGGYKAEHDHIDRLAAFKPKDPLTDIFTRLNLYRLVFTTTRYFIDGDGSSTRSVDLIKLQYQLEHEFDKIKPEPKKTSYVSNLVKKPAADIFALSGTGMCVKYLTDLSPVMIMLMVFMCWAVIETSKQKHDNKPFLFHSIRDLNLFSSFAHSDLRKLEKLKDEIRKPIYKGLDLLIPWRENQLRKKIDPSTGP